MRKILPSEITPEHVYLSRRAFMRTAGIAAGASLLLAACQGEQALVTQPADAGIPATPPTGAGATDVPAAGLLDELGNPATPFDSVVSYNNFYEFTTEKAAVAELASDFVATPWEVQVGGLVANPRTYDIDDLRSGFSQEERIYRLRCVEGWSMVIPWQGFSLAALLREVEPLAEAQYVRFETLYDPERMPGQLSPQFPWPYVEGLRLDEAMHDLTLMATGLYGSDLLPQSGAPVRLVVPWKYGFKSIKSVVKIDLLAAEPRSLWMTVAPREYGFYANVNPEVPHPRWSQARETRIGEGGLRDTLLFNGYEEQVAGLYAGMDLRQNY
ncbi:MAG: protein-methionine-sulfoxide reductase catalytic subunit MsrP [Anaerolineales bacterium]